MPFVSGGHTNIQKTVHVTGHSGRERLHEDNRQTNDGDGWHHLGGRNGDYAQDLRNLVNRWGAMR